MENLKIRVSNEEESKEAQQLFFELGATLGNGDHHAVMVPGAIGLAVIDGLINFVFNQIVHSDIAQAREITLPQLRDMVVLHRNDVNDATHINLVTGSRALLACGKNYYWQNEKWNEYPCGVDVKPIDKQQPDPATSPNDIAKTAETHREHNLSNELNDLCAEFGCPPGMDRFAWLKDQLDISQGRVTLGPLVTKARMQQESMELRLALLKDLFQPQPVTYHYAASINTARGTVAYDGVITMPQRITGMEDYLQARAEIAKDGNVAPEQVNIHSLSIIS